MAECPTCHTPQAGRFCVSCGEALSTPGCARCGASLPPGAKFCTGCGAPAASAKPGAAVDGEWLREAGEIVRRLGPEHLRRAGWLPEALGGRAVRVPAGSVGVVRVNGEVRRLLKPGWRGTPGWLQELREGGIEALLRSRELTVHLVDTRPLPMAWTVPHASGARTDEVRATLFISVELAEVGAFLDTYLGEREALTAHTLHAALQAKAHEALHEALRAHGDRWPQVERALEEALSTHNGQPHGLKIQATVAPVGTVHRQDLLLDGAGKPRLLTQDAQEVSLDLTLVAQGHAALPDLSLPLRAAAARALRGVPWAACGQIEGALQEAATQALEAHGLRLVSLTLVDQRSASGAWAHGARADLEARRARLAVDQEAQAHALSARRQGLAADQAQDQVAAGEAQLAETQAQRAHQQALADQTRQATQARAVQATQAERLRADAALRSDLQRRQVQDSAFAQRTHDQAQLDKLKAMADLEEQLAKAEHLRKLESTAALAGKTEAQIIALQAAELAKTEHGAAFAAALGKLADGEAAKAERAKAEAQSQRHQEQLFELTKAALGAHPACPHCRAPLPERAVFCGGCGEQV